MKVFALSGSPRKSGTSEKVLTILLRQLADLGYEVSFLRAADLTVSPCTECEYCYTQGKCCIYDAMMQIYKHLEDSDIVIFSTPIFFSGPSAQMKAVIDRLQAIWALKEKLGRKFRKERGKFVAVITGARNSEIDLRNTVSILKAASNTIDCDYAGEISFLKAEEPSDLPPDFELEKTVMEFIEKNIK